MGWRLVGEEACGRDVRAFSEFVGYGEPGDGDVCVVFCSGELVAAGHHGLWAVVECQLEFLDGLGVRGVNALPPEDGEAHFFHGVGSPPEVAQHGGCRGFP